MKGLTLKENKTELKYIECTTFGKDTKLKMDKTWNSVSWVGRGFDQDGWKLKKPYSYS